MWLKNSLLLFSGKFLSNLVIPFLDYAGCDALCIFIEIISDDMVIHSNIDFDLNISYSFCYQYSSLLT